MLRNVKFILMVVSMFLFTRPNPSFSQSLNVVQPLNATAVIAGAGNAAYNGDNGPATFAALNTPNGVAFDVDGNLYIADKNNNAIRKIDAETGVISTIAGTGQSGFEGDGNLATDATLNEPEFIGIDNDGNVFISDSGNHRVRKIDRATGTITTIIGSAELNPGDIAVDRINNIVLFIDRTTRTIQRILPSGNVSSLQLQTPSTDPPPYDFSPRDIAIDGSGNIVVHYMKGFGGTQGVIARYNQFTNSQDSVLVELLENTTVNGFSTFTADSEGNIFYTKGVLEVSGNGYQLFRLGLVESSGGFSELKSEPVSSTIYTTVPDLAVDSEGNVILANADQNQIVRVTNAKAFEPDIDFVTHLDLGDAIVGAEKKVSFPIKNTGNMKLKIVQIQSDNLEATISPTSIEIPVGDQGDFEVTFAPRETGNFAGVITVFSNDPDENSSQLSLSGARFLTEMQMDLELGSENKRLEILKGLSANDTISVQIFAADSPAITGYTISFIVDSRLVAMPDNGFTVGSFLPDALPITTISGDSIEVNVASTGSPSTVNGGLLGVLSLILKPEFADSTVVSLNQFTVSLPDGTLQTITPVSSTVTLSSETALIGDFTGDGAVGFPDFLLFAQNFGKSQTAPDFDSRFDLNNDGSVGFPDFLVFAQAFGSSI